MPTTDEVLAYMKRQDEPTHSTDVAAEFGIDNLDAGRLILDLYDQGQVERHHRNDGSGAILWVAR